MTDKLIYIYIYIARLEYIQDMYKKENVYILYDFIIMITCMRKWISHDPVNFEE